MEANATHAAKKAQHVLSFVSLQDALTAVLDGTATDDECERVHHLGYELDAQREADGFTLEDMMDGDRLAIDQRLQPTG